MPVMRQMVPVVDVRNRTDSPQGEDIRPKIISLNGGKKPAVHAVMGNDEERVITIADNGDGNQNGPPGSVYGHETHCRDNPSPANDSVNDGAPRLGRAQLLDLGG
jgi:hypothetical protein